MDYTIYCYISPWNRSQHGRPSAPIPLLLFHFCVRHAIRPAEANALISSICFLFCKSLFVIHCEFYVEIQHIIYAHKKNPQQTGNYTVKVRKNMNSYHLLRIAILVSALQYTEET